MSGTSLPVRADEQRRAVRMVDGGAGGEQGPDAGPPATGEPPVHPLISGIAVFVVCWPWDHDGDGPSAKQVDRDHESAESAAGCGADRVSAGCRIDQGSVVPGGV